MEGTSECIWHEVHVQGPRGVCFGLLLFCQLIMSNSLRLHCGLPGSSVHGIFQARVLEWVVISFSRGSSRPRARTQSSAV